MRVYHFLTEEYALDDIRRRRLKVATLRELNDPFELLGANLADQTLRYAVRSAKKKFAELRGFHCFSRGWQNPVQWSHYAAKHTGLCLGFDVRDEMVRDVVYSARRFMVDVKQLASMTTPDRDLFARFLFTKYSHWRYEKEVRMIVPLENRENGMYFSPFSEYLRLACVIVGAQSSLKAGVLRGALGDLCGSVEVFKGRLAFKSFQVVRQHNWKRWFQRTSGVAAN